MAKHLKEQLKAILGALVFAAVFIGIDAAFTRFDVGKVRGLRLTEENSVPITAATTALTVMGLFAVCIVTQSFGWAKTTEKIRSVAEFCHLFCLGALWLTALISLYTGGSLVVLWRALGLTVYLAALYWLTTGASVGSRVMATIFAIGFAAMFLASALGALSILFSV